MTIYIIGLIIASILLVLFIRGAHNEGDTE